METECSRLLRRGLLLEFGENLDLARDELVDLEDELRLIRQKADLLRQSLEKLREIVLIKEVD